MLKQAAQKRAAETFGEAVVDVSSISMLNTLVDVPQTRTNYASLEY